MFVRWVRKADAFSTLNYSKSKRIFAVDVEEHLRSMGYLAPVTTSSELNEEMELCHTAIYGRHNTPAPRNRVEV